MAVPPDATTSRRRGRPPRAERDAELRVAAIEVAKELLISGGGGLSMEGLARKLGVRAPSLYHHFPGGRDEMIVAIADHFGRMHGHALNAIVDAPGDIIAKLKSVVSYFAGPGAVHPYHILTEERSRLSELARTELRRIFSERVEAPLMRLIREGQQRNVLRPADVELSVRTVLILLLRLGQIKADEAQRAILPDFMVDVLVSGLGAVRASSPADFTTSADG